MKLQPVLNHGCFKYWPISTNDNLCNNKSVFAVGGVLEDKCLYYDGAEAISVAAPPLTTGKNYQQDIQLFRGDKKSYSLMMNSDYINQQSPFPE